MISTSRKIELENTEQYLIIRGDEKKSKPIMLFLHGGPGVPELFTMKQEMAELEKKFVMVYWEQRGAGKSYKAKGLTLEQIVSDTQELSRWLIEHYAQEKIYLMGHSWGTFLGLLVVQESPEYYHAYMGIGQVTNQYEAEKISLAWIKAKVKERHDKRAMKKIATLELPALDASTKEWSRFLNIHRSYLWKYGGSFVETKGVLWKMIKSFIFFREYSLKEKIMFVPSAIYSLEQLWHNVVSINLFETIKSVDVPVYIFQGEQDYQVSFTLAKAFFEQLKAPKKEFFSFEKSAHSPHIEESEQFFTIVNRLLP